MARVEAVDHPTLISHQHPLLNHNNNSRVEQTISAVMVNALASQLNKTVIIIIIAMNTILIVRIETDKPQIVLMLVVVAVKSETLFQLLKIMSLTI